MLANLISESNWVLPAGVVGLAVLGGLLALAYTLGRLHALRRNRAVLQAGRWTLDRLRGIGADHVRDADGGQLVVNALDRWYTAIRQEAQLGRDEMDHDVRQDIDLARDFQLAYINRPYPKVPDVHYENRLRLSFHHWYQPALALGGDFFDILKLAPDTAGVFVADVMGHGARSALITAILRTILRDSRSQGRNAPHFMNEVNRALCEIMESFPQPLFASAFYLVPDVTSRMATYSTAGHPAPFYLHRATNRVSRLTVSGDHGAALGILPGETYTGGHIRLIDGDAFLVFTDGIYEAVNAAGEEFGLERMQAVLQANVQEPMPVLLDALRAALEQFTGDVPLADDVCVVAVDVTTTPEKETDE